MEETKPEQIKQCSKCNGDVVQCFLYTAVGNTDLVPSYREGFVDTRRTKVRALTCIDCGHTELYAIDPQKLRPRKTGS